MSDEPRYEPYLTEDVGHTFSLGMDGDVVNDEDNETEPSYFTTGGREYDLDKLEKEVAKRNYSLGLHSGLDEEETEPEILVNPPEYDLDEVQEKSGQEEEESA